MGLIFLKKKEKETTKYSTIYITAPKLFVFQNIIKTMI